MHRGYIKLWRKIEDSFIFLDSETFHLWVTILLLANHADNEFMFNGKKTICKRGQFITGRKSLHEKTGISESKIYRLLDIFERENLIEQQKTNLFTLVSIVNYSEYQQNEQPVNNQRTTREQPVNTNNTLIRTKKNDKKAPKDPEDFITNLKDIYTWIDVDAELKKMNGWILANPKRKMTKRFAVNWLNKIDKPINTQEDYDI